MTPDQLTLVGILLAMMAMFVWGRWRHDMVAMGALLACVVAGLVPAGHAFAGFGHPAVITVACVLILSHALQSSGAADSLSRRLIPTDAGPIVTIAALTGLAGLLSAFMNNVGALALLLPVALKVAGRLEIAAGKVLMPVAFGSILGGMTTLIGTPPNLIVSGFRAETDAGSFAMFDFTPVGLVVAASGIVFISLFSWWLVPRRERADAGGFETGTYLTEARVPADSKTIGLSLYEIEAALEEADAQVIGLIRDEARLPGPTPGRKVRADDILIIEAEPEALTTAVSSLDLKLEASAAAEEAAQAVKQKQQASEEESSGEDSDDTENKTGESAIKSDEIDLKEFAVLPDSSLVGYSISDIQLRTRLGINLLAISRQGQRSISRLRSASLQAGDVLLLQGDTDALAEFASQFNCVPLAERQLHMPEPRKAALAGGIMLLAVGGAAFGLIPAAIAFALGVLAAMATRVVSPRSVYNAIDWPVIVLLGALLPVAGAMSSTGSADLLAHYLLDIVAGHHAVLAMGLILVVTMTLSDFMNNAATAAVMCPIAIGTANTLGSSADPFLMAVAVGASCAFLTPIGHQNNTLILGPGGFRFGDYWRLGLPLELLVIAVSLPMLLLIWPL